MRVAGLSLAVLLIAIAAPALAQEAAPLAAAPVTTLTVDTWGAEVGFAASAPPEGFQAGMTIDASNLAQWESIVPDPAARLVKHYGLTIRTTDAKPYAPSSGYINASNANRGKPRLVDIGAATDVKGIEEYSGGLPFPQPATGREIAWNFTLGYGGDDGRTEFIVFWVNKKRGVERSEIWRTTRIKSDFRTDIEPIPRVGELADNDVIVSALTQAMSPPDKKDYASLYYGYFSLKEPDGWLYIPQQRRSIRFSFGLKGESWNNSDMLYEDVRGYSGRPEWMNWKLVEKTTVLLPMHSNIPLGEGKAEEVYDFKTAPHWNFKADWELRPAYVVEATPKVPDYPYSRMLLWVDAESFGILAKTAYDRKGNVWKVLIHAVNASEPGSEKPGVPGAVLVVDLQSEHATAFHWREAESNIGADAGLFRQTTLRKLGR